MAFPPSTITFDPRYTLRNADKVLTPALLLYPEILDANIEATLRALGGDADRWRPHVKTAKLGYTMHRLVERGIENFKCATTLELHVACEAGARDVVVAYPHTGANARRVVEIAGEFPAVRVAALVESPAQLAPWLGTRVGIFIDVNPGMNRTGVSQERPQVALELARTIAQNGIEFRGLHYYDGHLGALDLAKRERVAHRGFDHLIRLVEVIERAGLVVGEVITSGTPAMPAALNYPRFRHGDFIHRVSPGTVVYWDATSVGELPQSFGYQPAVVVIARVISHPTPDRITCDAGHKTVSADQGVPTCVVLGHPGFQPLGPSEEHLPIQVPPDSPKPPIGDLLYLVPRHVCPTVNNFDEALLVSAHEIVAVERVTARGREAPLLRAKAELRVSAR